jgi:hypothetical protein
MKPSWRSWPTALARWTLQRDSVESFQSPNARAYHDRQALLLGQALIQVDFPNPSEHLSRAERSAFSETPSQSRARIGAADLICTPRHDRVPNTCHDTRHYRTLVTARVLVLPPRFSMTLAQVDRRDTRARVTALETPSSAAWAAYAGLSTTMPNHR